MSSTVNRPLALGVLFGLACLPAAPAGGADGGKGRAYVSNQKGNVSVIDLDTLEVVADIDFLYRFQRRKIDDRDVALLVADVGHALLGSERLPRDETRYEQRPDSEWSHAIAVLHGLPLLLLFTVVFDCMIRRRHLDAHNGIKFIKNKQKRARKIRDDTMAIATGAAALAH